MNNSGNVIEVTQETKIMEDVMESKNNNGIMKTSCVISTNISLYYPNYENARKKAVLRKTKV